MGCVKIHVQAHKTPALWESVKSCSTVCWVAACVIIGIFEAAFVPEEVRFKRHSGVGLCALAAILEPISNPGATPHSHRGRRARRHPSGK